MFPHLQKFCPYTLTMPWYCLRTVIPSKSCASSSTTSINLFSNDFKPVTASWCPLCVQLSSDALIYNLSTLLIDTFVDLINRYLCRLSLIICHHLSTIDKLWSSMCIDIDHISCGHCHVLNTSYSNHNMINDQDILIFYNCNNGTILFDISSLLLFNES